MIRSSSGKTVARRLLIGIGAMALLTLATAGCEAGLNAPTLEFHQASAGTHTVFDGITISNAFVLAAPSGSSLPAGSSAGLFLGLFNGGSSSDALVSASAPGAAASVKLTGGTISLPVNYPVYLTGPEPHVVLNGLKKPLSGGQTVVVTLNFQHAGSLTITVPVEPQSYYYATYSAAPTPTPSASATKTPAAKTSATPSPSPSPSS